MEISLFKLTSLNLNGIRSATSKGLEAWLAQGRPDCICVQEVKAQAADIAGKFESLAGLTGHFHFAQKKGYSGVGVYTRREPSDVVVGFGSPEFDAEGRYLELRFDFLHANTIGPRCGKPGLQSFAGGGADAVEIETA